LITAQNINASPILFASSNTQNKRVKSQTLANTSQESSEGDPVNLSN
jgi:hypothetical protein